MESGWLKAGGAWRGRPRCSAMRCSDAPNSAACSLAGRGAGVAPAPADRRGPPRVGLGAGLPHRRRRAAGDARVCRGGSGLYQAAHGRDGHQSSGPPRDAAAGALSVAGSQAPRAQCSRPPRRLDGEAWMVRLEPPTLMWPHWEEELPWRQPRIGPGWDCGLHCYERLIPDREFDFLDRRRFTLTQRFVAQIRSALDTRRCARDVAL